MAGIPFDLPEPGASGTDRGVGPRVEPEDRQVAQVTGPSLTSTAVEPA